MRLCEEIEKKFLSTFDLMKEKKSQVIKMKKKLQR